MKEQNASTVIDTIRFLYRIKGSDFIPCTGDVSSTAEYAPAGAATRLCVVWKNNTDKTLDCQFEIRIKTNFAYTQYVIPAVNYNGNGWGKGKEPKGLIRDGEPWVFDHRRTSVPACTISENKDSFFAVFASNQDAASLNASCSMICHEDGSMQHRLLYPCIEKPLTYRDRDTYADAHEAYIKLAPGACFRTSAYLVGGVPEKESYAAAQVEDAALDLLASPFMPRYNPDELQTLCCAFAKRLLIETDGIRLISTGKHLKDGAYTPRVDYEFGWCGQNGMYARLFLQRGYETNDAFLIETGEGILDFWSGGVGKTGLVYTRYDSRLSADRIADVCNLSYVIEELTRAYVFLQEKGTEKRRWLSAAENVADFLIARFHEETGFGKAWDAQTGACTDDSGTIGAFLIPALCTLYKATGKEPYLRYAEKACRFYRDRDLSHFMCSAGALDTYCIDKETSGPMLAGALALYEIDKKEEWLECAKMAGWYFCSWMFHHDTLPVSGSDFAEYGYRTLGGTSVSAQHHHLDPWGARIVPQLIMLWKYTGDRHWRQRAALIWANAIQNIAPIEGTAFRGHQRFAGAQNETYFQCSWGGSSAPGEINEWLVSWPQAFIWDTAVFLSDRHIEP